MLCCAPSTCAHACGKCFQPALEKAGLSRFRFYDLPFIRQPAKRKLGGRWKIPHVIGAKGDSNLHSFTRILSSNFGTDSKTNQLPTFSSEVLQNQQPQVRSSRTRRDYAWTAITARTSIRTPATQANTRTGNSSAMSSSTVGRDYACQMTPPTSTGASCDPNNFYQAWF